MARKPRAKGPGRVLVRASIWVMPHDERIRIAVTSHEPRFISTVAIDPSSDRYHGHLYSKLRAMLKKQGKWIKPPEAEPPPKPKHRPKE